MSIPGQLPGMGANNQMQGMNENEQWMIKMVRLFLPSEVKSNRDRLLTRAIDAKWNGIVSREDRHGRYNGFRSGWCFRSLHGQCKISPLTHANENPLTNPATDVLRLLPHTPRPSNLKPPLAGASPPRLQGHGRALVVLCEELRHRWCSLLRY